MAKNLYFTISDDAWTKLRDLPEHKYRAKAYQQFDGHRYVTMEPPSPSAKGLGIWLTNFLFSPRSQYHNPEPPYAILPETFEDRREWALEQYEFYGFPGQPLNLTIYNYDSIHSRRFPAYTVWNNGTVPNRHGIWVEWPDLFYKVATDITNYWHISLPGGFLPRSPQECVSAFLNAFGLDYLVHSSLNPETASISDNTYYRQMDARLEHMKEQAKQREQKTKIDKMKRVKCKNIKVLDNGNFTCSKPAEYVLEFATQETLLCFECMVDRTKHLPGDAYKIRTYKLPTAMPASEMPKIKFKIVPRQYGPKLNEQNSNPYSPTYNSNSDMSTDSPVGSEFDPSTVKYNATPTFVPVELTEKQRIALAEFHYVAEKEMSEGVAYELEQIAHEEEELAEFNKARLDKLKQDLANDK